MKDSLALRQWQWYVFLLVPIVNFGANWLFENPFDDAPQIYIQPADFAFSVWGPIFIGMILYSWYVKQPGRRENEYLRRATIFGISAGLASICFVPLPYLKLDWLSMLNILWHLVSLIGLFVCLKKYLENDKEASRWWFVPTQMYLGWISAATAVSIALFLRELGVGYDQSTEVSITIGVMIALCVVGLFLISQGGMVAAIIIIWALYGLRAEYGEIEALSQMALIGMILLAVASVAYAVFKKKWIF